MFRQCRHIKDDGQRCRTGALKGKPYCFFHMKLKGMHSHPMIRIPALEDSTSVLLAIDQVMRLLALETMDTKRAGLMLYGLQIASSVIQNREQARPEDYVRSVHDEAGNPIDFSEALICETPVLAPESTVCEPPQDCADCEQKSSCAQLAKLQKENPEEPSAETMPGAPSKPLPDTPRPDTLSAAWVGNIEPSPHSPRNCTQAASFIASQQASGHDFSRAAKNQNSTWASAPAITGGSRGLQASEMLSPHLTGASAPENPSPHTMPGAPSKPLPDTPRPDTLSAAWVGNIEPPPHVSSAVLAIRQRIPLPVGAPETKQEQSPEHHPQQRSQRLGTERLQRVL